MEPDSSDPPQLRLVGNEVMTSYKMETLLAGLHKDSPNINAVWMSKCFNGVCVDKSRMKHYYG